MNWNALADSISKLTGTPFQIESAAPVGGGDIHNAYRLHSAEGNFFLKSNQSSQAALFETEANSLQALSSTLSITVPKVIATGVENDQAWLLLEYIELTPQGDDFQRGKDLALLHHQINETKQFGWFEDNFIGKTRQPNGWTSDWVQFYGQNRLLPQLKLALSNGASPVLMDKGMQLIDKLPDFFQTYQPEASPLHGDLWGGNSSFTHIGEAVFYDPASYYGDRETDLAMTELFGGFRPDFYQGYDSVFPLDRGYSQRKNLYNLYHVLNHFNLFGGHYANQSERMIQTLLDSV